MERLYEVLKNCCPTVDFEGEKKLVTDGVIDSVDLVSVISDIEEEFDISIDMENITPENFDSVEAMWALINRIQK